ncbi:MAG TPA: acetylxylan esterase [Cyclobacteriaceae bacterium]|nr:acetylxylan esterase [Cyclobacteriaceae bacterium]
MKSRISIVLTVLFFSALTVASQDIPAADAFTVIKNKRPAGPDITPYLKYQTRQAWQYDDLRRKALENIRDEKSLMAFKAEIKAKVLNMLGGLPSERTPLNPTITGRIQMKGFHIEKLIFESVPGFRVTALVYVPDDGSKKHPAILVACGHSTNGKIHYQALCQRLVQRGYVVICWDPVGQGERSQFWDEAAGKSRYNLVCGEHAILGNFAYLAGANLMRWEAWDGIRAVDYLLTRPDVDAGRISITGTSGGGAQAAHIGALDERIKVVAPSCYISSLPMRAYNRIFADPDSDPEQDLYGSVSEGVDHAGLLLLVYPRPLFIASAVLDFFPIEGTRKTFREVSEIYERFGKRESIDMVEGYHKHQFSPENQEAAMNFIDHFNNLPKIEGLPPVTDVNPKELLCTQKGQVSLDFPGDKKLMDLIRDYVGDRQQTTTYSIADQYYGKGYPNIKNWPVAEYRGVPGSEKIEWEKKGQFQFNGIAIDQYLLHHSENLQMSLLHFHATKGPGNKAVLWLNLEGKTSKEQWIEISDLIRKGEDVISFDFRGTGEDRMRYQAISSDDLTFDNTDSVAAYFSPLSGVSANYVYNSLLVGRPYFLQMIEDTEIAVRFARLRLGSKEISITGTEKTQFLLRQIVKTLPDLKSLGKTDDHNEWLEIVTEKRERWPIQYLLPGGAYVR